MATEAVSTGMTLMDLLRVERFAEIRDMFAPNLRAMVTAESLRAVWTAEVDRHGPLIRVGAAVIDPADPGGTLVKIPVGFQRDEMTVVVSVDDAGWLTGIQLAPVGTVGTAEPWQPPGYADPQTFDEHDVTIGAGPLAVPGTLSLPRQPGPHPALVLLVGSGPQDRDSTIGRNKPFKDLAWGLAGRGVAVLRFDKVTYAHRDLLAKTADFTLADEYVHHALAATRLLREHPAVDPARVFVAGHSLGGTATPRVAAAEPAVAGLIIMAGGAQPLHWAIVRQFRYLAAQDPDTAAAHQPIIETVIEQARMVDSPHLSPATPTSDLPFGVPASYWLDLRGYDPAATAATLHKPILILQGGRDYQSTVTDDLARWKTALADRTDVTIRIYDVDNHLFFPGTGPSIPAEYESAQHVDPAVIADIATWLNSTRPAPTAPTAPPSRQRP